MIKKIDEFLDFNDLSDEDIDNIKTKKDWLNFIEGVEADIYKQTKLAVTDEFAYVSNKVHFSDGMNGFPIECFEEFAECIEEYEELEDEKIGPFKGFSYINSDFDIYYGVNDMVDEPIAIIFYNVNDNEFIDIAVADLGYPETLDELISQTKQIVKQFKYIMKYIDTKNWRKAIKSAGFDIGADISWDLDKLEKEKGYTIFEDYIKLCEEYMGTLHKF